MVDTPALRTLFPTGTRFVMSSSIFVTACRSAGFSVSDIKEPDTAAFNVETCRVGGGGGGI